MAEGRIQNVRISGVASAVPDQLVDAAGPVNVFGAEDVEKILNSTGTRLRRQAKESNPRMCVSDLCVAAASKLLQELAWDRDSIGAVILVTQTPDYRLPATACVVSARLGLSKACAALDVNLGCSGYVYGLWLASSLISSGTVRRVLVMVGDMLPLFLSPQDRSTSLLFGDAGSVTAVEFDSDAPPMWFVLGTDGRGYDSLVIPAGASRLPSNEQSRTRRQAENGNMRSSEELFMDGSEIFTFTLREVPGMVKSVLAQAKWSEGDVDAFVFHQANQFMLSHLAKRMKIPVEKVPLSLGDYGNTSSASIPITINHCLGLRVRNEAMNLVLAGFGVGFSWAAVALTCGPIAAPNVIEVPASAAMAYGEEVGV